MTNTQMVTVIAIISLPSKSWISLFRELDMFLAFNGHRV